MLLLLLSLSACRRGETTDSTPPENPWLDHPVQSVDAFRPMLQTELPEGGAERLIALPDEPLWMVPGDKATWVLDDRYELNGRVACLEAERFEAVSYSSEWQESCEIGEVSLRRGRLPGLVALGPDLDAKVVWAVSQDGALFRVPFDLRATHPWAWLRAERVADLGREDVVDARVVPGGLELLAGEELLLVDLDDYSVSSAPLAAQGTVFSEMAIGTTRGVIRGGVLERGPGVQDLADSDQGLWLARGKAGLVGPDGMVYNYPASRVATDGEVVYFVGEGGLWRMEQGTAERLLEGDFIDVETLPSHEVVVLADTEVRVFVDERPLLEGPAPLSIWVQTFLEKPRTPTEDRPCTAGGESVETYVRSAAANSRLLADVPGTVALDVTPFYARRILECEMEGPIQKLFGRRDLELGVLYHDPPLCRGDLDCLVEQLEADRHEVESLVGLPAGHVSGLTPVLDDGDDWVAGLIAADVPKVITFVGMSLLPDVVHLGDPRAKERWPLEMSQSAAPWSISSIQTPEVNDGGEVRVLPSNTRAAFSQEGCGSMLLRECFVLGMGEGLALSERDVAQLDLALHRALAFRGDSGVWSFHMPDLGSWDYTEGCDRDWEGTCDAQGFRDWLIDVHARWVQSGAAQWSVPSEHG